ncbi:MAG TPA: penicillin-binding protein 2 [Solirubrobacteraceae bacterium]|nr:penicillin-binding protein 2 [Solirubrobacteraceae bacterium]
MIGPSDSPRRGPRFGTPEEDRPPLSPQLALRAAIIGTCALALFAIIFFRLWFLQVLSGNQYLAQANTNRVRDIAIAAQRGQILDANGTTLVDSIPALAVRISPPDLPVPVTLANMRQPSHADTVIYNRLAHVLGMPTRRTRCKIAAPPPNVLRLSPVACDVAKQIALLPYADVTVRSGSVVSKDVQFYLAERQDRFPGVQVQRIYLTHYPMKKLAAQVLGTVGPINSTEIKQRAYKGVSPNAIIGQSGLEAWYDSWVRGTDGAQRVQVNSLGQPTGDLATKSPVAGHNLKLWLNARVQQTGEKALQQSISANAGAGGAFVAMNPQNGSVYAMGSLPSYDPSVFTGNLSQATYQRLTSPNNGDPLLNRAMQSEGPTGSTFKVITATAAMQSGAWSPGESYDDTGTFSIDGQTRHNSGNAAYGVVNMVSALQVSDDDFFYNLGAVTNTANPIAHPNGGALDQWARNYGIGRRTGIDVAGEIPGTLPTPKWRASRNRLEAQCDSATGPFAGRPKHAPGGCGIADGTNRPWSVGDNINLGVGQGDVQVSPLQLAVVYSALANGGTIVRPHIGQDVQTQNGTILQTIDPRPARHLNINPIYLETIRAGLRAAASQQGGTSAPVFSNFPQQVYGKTGTAQYINGGVEHDYAWYACFVPASATSKPITVVVTVEKGGFGAVAAAPVARQILSQWFFGKPGPFQAGSSATL